ncbi:MAG TPA: sigma 54-interacting transcriptional regulator [Blastocatellia bacterium]|nr:sigma 54-interacting transcriptional regulator [Blastocatellia bacterium]
MATDTLNYSYPSDEVVVTGLEPHTTSRLIRERVIGASGWSEKARALLSAHAAHDNPVVLEGEPGTGKRSFARLVHRCSPHRNGPFVSLKFDSGVYELARSALLEPARAIANGVGEKGLIELTNRGTIYVEGGSIASSGLIDEMLRFIELRRADDEAGLDVRFIFGSVTHSEPYRSRRRVRAVSSTCGLEKIEIPPLRERPDDIEPLTTYFIRRACEGTGKEPRAISPDAMDMLRAYDWPRNVAELKALVNLLVRQSGPPSIDISLLPAYMLASREAKGLFPDSGLDLAREVRRYEIDLICVALKQSRGRQRKAAQLLRIMPTTLFEKLKRYGIDAGSFK